MIYGILLVVAILARLMLEAVPVDYVSAGQQSIGSWRFFAIFVVCYGTAVLVAARAGLPSPRETLARSRIALGLPAAVGIAVALVTIVSDVLEPAAAARGVATVHIHGAAAVPFHAYGEDVGFFCVAELRSISIRGATRYWLPRTEWKRPSYSDTGCSPG